MRPINDVVLILPDEPEQLILTNAKEKVYTGIVLKVGEKVKDVKPKDHVVFNATHVNEYTVNGEEIYTIREESIYAKLTS